MQNLQLRDFLQLRNPLTEAAQQIGGLGSGVRSRCGYRKVRGCEKGEDSEQGFYCLRLCSLCPVIEWGAKVSSWGGTKAREVVRIRHPFNLPHSSAFPSQNPTGFLQTLTWLPVAVTNPVHGGLPCQLASLGISQSLGELSHAELLLPMLLVSKPGVWVNQSCPVIINT